MAVQEQLELLVCDIYQWNQWRREEPHLRPDLSGADLSRTNLSGANLNGAILFRALLHDTILNDAILNSTDLSWADLSRADLSGASLLDANLVNANLRNAMLHNAVLNDADLTGANLTGADLTDATLRAADLRDAVLDNTNLCGAYFLDTNLRDAELNNTNLRGAILNNTNLRGAELNNADLHNAELNNANLCNAQMGGANLCNAQMSGADFSGVHFHNTIFAQVNLSLVKGLGTAIHHGLSFVDVNTVIFPQDGHIRTHFLRGVGFSETQIEYLPSFLTPRPIQYHSLFISSTSQDVVIARKLHTGLCENKVSCWFALHDLQPGNYFRERIDQAIHSQDKVLLLLSKHSVESGWVRYEVELAMAKENHQQREILFPIRLDNAIFNCTASWATSLQTTRHIGDFTNWQDDTAYQHAFTTLLQHLKVMN